MSISYTLLFLLIVLLPGVITFGDPTDCIMDGLQNVSQAENQTYKAQVRHSCRLYNLPPNYFGVKPLIYFREEAKNETFIDSLDYFVTKEKEQSFFWYFIYNIATNFFLTVGFSSIDEAKFK